MSWADMAKWPTLAEVADHPYLWLIIDTFNHPSGWRFILTDEYSEMPFDD